jgi:hypothetical protein
MTGIMISSVSLVIFDLTILDTNPQNGTSDIADT